jgi:hypothetical protein
MVDLSPMSRRRMLTGAAAGLAGVAAGWSPAWAKAPMANTQAPAFYRFKLGAFELTAISDGPLRMARRGRMYSTPARKMLVMLATTAGGCGDGAERAAGECTGRC